MSCGEPHETDCSEVLDHLYEFLDREMPEGDCTKFEVHFEECSPCLEKYGLEQAVKKLVKRCCGQDDVPTDLRSKVMGRIDLIRACRGRARAGSDRAGHRPVGDRRRIVTRRCFVGSLGSGGTAAVPRSTGRSGPRMSGARRSRTGPAPAGATGHRGRRRWDASSRGAV